MKAFMTLLVFAAFSSVYAMDQTQLTPAELLKDASALPLDSFCAKLKSDFPLGIDPSMHATSIYAVFKANNNGLETFKKVHFLVESMKVNPNCDYLTSNGKPYSLLSVVTLRTLNGLSLAALSILLNNGADPLYKSSTQTKSSLDYARKSYVENRHQDAFAIYRMLAQYLKKDGLSQEKSDLLSAFTKYHLTQTIFTKEERKPVLHQLEQVKLKLAQLQDQENEEASDDSQSSASTDSGDEENNDEVD